MLSDHLRDQHTGLAVETWSVEKDPGMARRIYYGLLIASRPVILWNFIAMIINFVTVYAYFRFARSEVKKATG